MHDFHGPIMPQFNTQSLHKGQILLLTIKLQRQLSLLYGTHMEAVLLGQSTTLVIKYHNMDIFFDKYTDVVL